MGEERPGVLKIEMMKTYVEMHLKDMCPEDVCAMFLVRFDAFEEMQAVLGKKEAEDAVSHAGQLLSSLFRAADIVGCGEKASFYVFLYGAAAGETVFERARTLCEKLQFTAEGKPSMNLTVSAGVYLACAGEMTFERLCGGAEEALREAGKNGKGSFYVYSDLEEETGTGALLRPANTIQLHTLLKYMDGGVCLIELGPELRLLYASPGFYQMTGKAQEGCSLPCGLDQAGIHPDYRLEYEQVLRDGAEKGGVVSHIHRIQGRGGAYIWRQIRAVRLVYPGSSYPVMLEVSTDISELVETQRRLYESNERLRVAFGQTPHVLWEVDIEKRTFNTYNVNTQTCAQDTMLENFPEAMIESGMIHPSSAANFRLFADALLEGNGAGSGNFIMRDGKNGCYEWVSMSYRMTCDREGKPVKAIGVEEKLPGISGIRPALTPRRPLPEILRHHLLARIRADITADFVEDLWMYGAERTAWTWGKSYEEIVGSEDTRLFIRGEGAEFEERYKRENVLKAFERGERWSSRELRVVDSGGNIRWVADTVNLQKDPVIGDIYMFCCFNDIQERHEWENLLEEGVEREGLGLPYTLQTIRRLCGKLIERGGETLCYVVLIRMIGGLELLDGEDQAPGLRLRDFLATALSFALGTDCLIGWSREDELLAFFPNGGTRFAIKRRIEDAFAYVRVSMADMKEIDRLRLVAGVSGGRIGDADYQVMVLQAGYLCELWENSAMDAVVFPNEDEDWAWTNLQKDVQKVSVESPAALRPLTREEQNAALNCVTGMLTSSCLEESLEGALRCIGEYYRADRTYLLVLSEENEEVTMLYEWTGKGKHSIQQVVSGMKLSRMPLLARCVRENKPVFAESQGNGMWKNSQEEVWHFMAYPLEEGGKTSGFVCVENPQKHMAESFLLQTIIPYVQKEHTRFRTQLGSLGSVKDDVLNHLPNLRSYMNVIYSLNSDLYSAMGALALDIPNFSGINSSYGFEYGREILRYIADTLSGVFGKSFIFRTWDAEFVVLFPNTIQEVFTSRCTRVRTMLQRRYPHQIRLGQTWADGVFYAKDLVREARSLMNCEDVKEVSSERNVFLGLMLPKEGQTDLESRYLIYFQPKIDMRDGSLMGAEALARAVDQEGNIIPPARFIEELEESGEIRELDFFMLESALRQLSEWKTQGFAPVHVSVNISRKTLFNPTTLASVLAIQSHYPEIPPEQVDLEITETAGDVERATLADVVNSFGEYGICFELDDFGSHYANMAVFSSIRFHTVKLDRSLISDLPDNAISRMLIENIANICRNFGMECVAEGVETRQQEAALLKAGCICGQGYYYDRPLPPQKFEEKYLRTDKRQGVM